MLQEMRKHIRRVALLHALHGLLLLLVGLFLLFASLIAEWWNEPIFAASILSPFWIPGVLEVLGGQGLRAGKRWAMKLVFGLSIIVLIIFPIGTILGFYSLVVLSDENLQKFFTGGSEGQTIYDEIGS